LFTQVNETAGPKMSLFKISLLTKSLREFLFIVLSAYYGKTSNRSWVSNTNWVSNWSWYHNCNCATVTIYRKSYGKL